LQTYSQKSRGFLSLGNEGDYLNSSDELKRFQDDYKKKIEEYQAKSAVITYELTRREIETETILYKYFIDKYA
jgi:hypothetical protein